VKEILFASTPENFLSKEGISKIFPLLANSQWKFLRCLCLPAAAGGVNYPLLPATVNVTLGPPLGLYFSFSIILVFSRFVAFFGVFVGYLGFYSHPHPDSSSFLRFFLVLPATLLQWELDLFQLRFRSWPKHLVTLLTADSPHYQKRSS